MIYLRSSIPNLVDQIHRRGREYENSISIDYLSRLNERYEAWIHDYDKGKLLIVDVDDLNFVDKPEDLGKIIEMIDARQTDNVGITPFNFFDSHGSNPFLNPISSSGLGYL